MNKEELMSENAPMYIYATEMVSDYYKKFNLINKKVLTICGSGDQVLNALFFKAKKVVGTDLNKRSELITDLKVAAIKQIDYEDFLDFFGRDMNSIFLNYSFYVRIRKNLNKKAKNFFDKAYKLYNYDGEKLAKSKYFRQRSDFQQQKVMSINAYLKNKKSYLKMRKILQNKKFVFVQGDITKITEKINEKFDIINLSNTPNYLCGKLKREGIKDCVRYLINNLFLKLNKRLSINGRIIYYTYSPQTYPNRIAKKMAPISTNKGVKSIILKTNFRVSQKNIKGINKGTKDKVIIIQNEISKL